MGKLVAVKFKVEPVSTVIVASPANVIAPAYELLPLTLRILPPVDTDNVLFPMVKPPGDTEPANSRVPDPPIVIDPPGFAPNALSLSTLNVPDEMVVAPE